MSTTRLERLSGYIDVEDLMTRCLGNIDLATRILGVLNNGCEADLDQLERALSEENAERVAEVSHRLKGAFANSAAYGLSKRADELCNSARNSISEMSDRLTGLRREWDQLAALIDAPRASNT